MFMNFCDSCLEPKIHCSTISTEGYEVTNLTTKSSNGFLAYSCIKPPVYIDLTFICNIQISHILIWPNVGAQKSSGFQLSAKLSDDEGIPYSQLSTGCLTTRDSGLLFHRRDVDKSNICVPPNFLHCHIKISDQRLVDCTRSLRICIFKTENSVLALGKVEVWGQVSRYCKKEVAANVQALWTNEQISQAALLNASLVSANDARKTEEKDTTPLQVPEEFFDPITCDVMIQPIILPSGKIIDQSTLEKHNENEALWGRSSSDPFTGIPFSEFRRPVIAAALKVRLDKYLLDNSTMEDIRKLPRELGYRSRSSLSRIKVLQTSKIVSEDNTNGHISNVKVGSNNCTVQSKSSNKKDYYHKLPVVAVSTKSSASSKDVRLSKTKKTINVYERETDVSSKDSNEMIKIDSNLEKSVQTVLSNLRRFSEPQHHKLCDTLNNCTCCTNSILYELPCGHVLCRKVLMSIRNFQCSSCDMPYKTSDPKRIHR